LVVGLFGVWREVPGRPRRIVGRGGVRKEIVAQGDAAIKKARDSDEFKEFMNRRGFGVIYMDAAKFGEFMKVERRQRGAEVTGVGGSLRLP
jgi:tripartite-type tricarboxylate transporter receptor subunit TctC